MKRNEGTRLIRRGRKTDIRAIELANPLPEKTEIGLYFKKTETEKRIYCSRNREANKRH